MPVLDVKLTPRKWGNSIAVVIPEAVVKQANIRIGRPVEFLIPEKGSFLPLLGTLKTKKSAQELKDEARAGWR